MRLRRINFAFGTPKGFPCYNYSYWSVKEYPEYTEHSDCKQGFLCPEGICQVFGFDENNPPKKIQLIIYSCQNKGKTRKSVCFDRDGYVEVNGEFCSTVDETKQFLRSIPLPKVWVECKIVG